MPKVVGLVDVDDTLTFGLKNLFCQSLDKFRHDFIHSDKINLPLIHALRLSGIKDIYLYTSMVLSAYFIINHRLALIELLENQYGFKVHGVLTPPDCGWGISQDMIEQIISNEELTNLHHRLTYFRKQHYPQKYLPLLNEYQQAYLKYFPDLMKSHDVLKFSSNEHLGIAFQQAVDALGNYKKFDANKIRCEQNASFGVMQSDADLKSGKKALMYELFEKHNTQFDSCLLFDDLPENMESIVQILDAKEKDEERLDINTIYIHPTYRFDRYYTLIAIKLAALEYLTYLEQLDDDRYDIELLNKKRELVGILLGTLEPSLDKIYDAYKASSFIGRYKMNRELIYQDATQGCSRFMKTMDEILDDKFLHRFFYRAVSQLKEVAFDENQYDESLKTIGKTIYHKLVATKFIDTEDYLNAIEIAEVIRQGILHPEDPHNFTRCHRLTLDWQTKSDREFIGLFYAFSGLLLMAGSITLCLCSNGILVPATAPLFSIGKALLLSGILSCTGLALGSSYLAFEFFERSQYGLVKALTLFGSTLNPKELPDPIQDKDHFVESDSEPDDEIESNANDNSDDFVFPIGLQAR